MPPQPSSRIARAARWRVPLGFVFGALALWLAEPTPRSLMIGAAIACLGEGLRVWAAGHIHKSREVTSSGPYRWFAHPLYVGSSIMGVGLSVAAHHVLVAVLVLGYLAVTIAIAVKAEEAFLRSKFGDAYSEYRRRPAGAGPDARGFDVAQVMANREYRAMAGLVLVLAALLLKLR